jgi:hypothetical protein
MRKEGEVNFELAGKTAIRSTETMISPLMSKVNRPIYLISLAFGDCSEAEASAAS